MAICALVVASVDAPTNAVGLTKVLLVAEFKVTILFDTVAPVITVPSVPL